MERGLPLVEISLHELKDWKRFQQLCEACGLILPETAKTAHAALTAQKVNSKPEFPEKSPDVPFEIQEEAVWKEMGSEGLRLRSEVKARYGYV